MTRFKVTTFQTYEKTKGEVNNMPSMTVPDQSMSVQELLSRHTRGLPLNHLQREVYYDESETIDISRLDLTEIQDLKDDNKNLITELRKKSQPQPQPQPQPTIEPIEKEE